MLTGLHFFLDTLNPLSFQVSVGWRILSNSSITLVILLFPTSLFHRKPQPHTLGWSEYALKPSDYFICIFSWGTFSSLSFSWLWELHPVDVSSLTCLRPYLRWADAGNAYFSSVTTDNLELSFDGIQVWEQGRQLLNKTIILFCILNTSLSY